MTTPKIEVHPTDGSPCPYPQCEGKVHEDVRTEAEVAAWAPPLKVGGEGTVSEPAEGPHPTDGSACPHARCGGKVHLDATND